MVSQHIPTSFVVLSYGVHDLKTPRQKGNVQEFSRPCALCEGTSHVNNQCPAAGSKDSEITTCGICQTYFNYARKLQEPQLHLLSHHGYVRPDSCPILAQISQAEKANFLRGLNRYTACFSRAGHKLTDFLNIPRVKKYICVHPSCYCHRDVCPSPEHNNPARLKDCWMIRDRTPGPV